MQALRPMIRNGGAKHEVLLSDLRLALLTCPTILTYKVRCSSSVNYHFYSDGRHSPFVLEVKLLSVPERSRWLLCLVLYQCVTVNLFYSYCLVSLVLAHIIHFSQGSKACFSETRKSVFLLFILLNLMIQLRIFVQFRDGRQNWQIETFS